MNQGSGIKDNTLQTKTLDISTISRVFRDSMEPFYKSGPISLMRILLRTSKLLGSTTLTYHVMDPIEPLRSHPLYSHFGRSRSLSRYRIATDLEKDVVETHAFVLKRGTPTSISSLIPKYLEKNPARTNQVMERLREVGIEDEYMIPVYGSNSIHAVISFGFPIPVSDVQPWKLELLESLALLSHTKMIRHFKNKQPRIKLSKQEKSVLVWISRGKSNSEIATILGLSGASVDTYVRRIFEKLDVNNRVSAALRGLLSAMITP